MKAISLFSGIGGLDLAVEMAGIEVAAVCEIDKDCQRVLARHFPNAKQYDDVRTIASETLRRDGVPRPDLVFGGWPCQGNSVAGLRAGMSDPRSGLWGEFVRIVDEIRPRWVVGENVPGALSVGGGRDWRTVLDSLAALGYRVGWGTWGADDLGFSHRRKRVFVVGRLVADSYSLRERSDLGESIPRADGRNNASRLGATMGDSRELGLPGDARRGAGQEPKNGRGPMDHSEGVEDDRRRLGSVAGSKGRGGGLDPADRDAGGELADASCVRLERLPERERGEQKGGRGVQESWAGSPELADAESMGRTPRSGVSIGGASSQPGSPHGCVRIPGPADLGAWSELLRVRPDLSPALTSDEEAQLEVRPELDGISRRMALKMLGNAVVPAQAYPLFKAIVEADR